MSHPKGWLTCVTDLTVSWRRLEIQGFPLPPRHTRTRIRPQNRFDERRASLEVEAELEHIRDLVRLRAIFARHGVTKAELRAYDAEIERHRRALAQIAPHTAREQLTAA